MSAATVTIADRARLASVVRERGRGGLSYAASDIVTIVRRNLIKNIRIPQLIIFTTIQPILLLLLFTFVFGGVIRIPGINYVDYMVPAVLIQTVTFSAMGTGLALATDLQEGIIDRFRSLPIARSAVLAGRTMADGVRMILQVLMMLVVAHLVGFRFHAGPARAVGLVAVVVLFGFAFSWISAWIGLSVRDPETAQAAGFIWVFPLIFGSSAFAPLLSLPGWLQPFARVNPVSAAADTMRGLALGGPVFTHLWHILAWLAFIIAVSSTLAVRQYRRAV